MKRLPAIATLAVLFAAPMLAQESPYCFAVSPDVQYITAGNSASQLTDAVTGVYAHLSTACGSNAFLYWLSTGDDINGTSGDYSNRPTQFSRYVTQFMDTVTSTYSLPFFSIEGNHEQDPAFLGTPSTTASGNPTARDSYSYNNSIGSVQATQTYFGGAWSPVPGQLANLVVATAGSGQTPGTYSVTATGGGFSSEPTASITVGSGGTVTTPPVVTSVGVGGTSAPTFTLSAGGTPATFTATLNSGIANVFIVTAGSGQTPGTYPLTGSCSGVTGCSCSTYPVISVTVAAGGTVTATPTITTAGVCVSSGSGNYQVQPVFTLSAGGTPATFMASLVDQDPEVNQWVAITNGSKTIGIMGLEFCQRTAAVTWAAGVIAAHSTFSDWWIMSHGSVYESGVLSTRSGTGTGTSGCFDTSVDGVSDNTQGAGTDIWAAVQGYANVRGIFGGHYSGGSGDYAAHSTLTGTNGNVVLVAYVNHQYDVTNLETCQTIYQVTPTSNTLQLAVSTGCGNGGGTGVWQWLPTGNTNDGLNNYTQTLYTGGPPTAQNIGGGIFHGGAIH